MTVKAEVKCTKHPHYQAKREPTAECGVCRFIYKLLNNKQHLLGFTERLHVKRFERAPEKEEVA